MPAFYSDSASPSFYALTAIAAAAGDTVTLSRDPYFVSAAKPAPERTVALVSGGGAGHDPMHAGFVGRGGLDAAVPGEVFTSPHSRQIFEASRAVAKDGGVLHIVKNYTGDCINFNIAAERLSAEGIESAQVLVDDDLGTDAGAVGRRGIAGTTLVEKILGAAADSGLSLGELKELGDALVAATRSLSVARRAHTSPGADQLAFDVNAGELEYGVGIHGESAKETIAQPTLEKLAQRMVSELREALAEKLEASAGALLFVNGLGGLAPLELLHIQTAAHEALADAGVNVRIAFSGNYTTALDMAGFSLTLNALNEEWLEYVCAPHDTVALPSPRLLPDDFDVHAGREAENAGEGDGEHEASEWLTRFVETLAHSRAALDEIDQKAGDGDVGTNLANAAKATLAHAGGADADLASDLNSIAEGFLNDTGGSSGPLFGLAFQEIAAAAKDGRTLVEGVRQARAAVTRVGGAEPGDRTIVDVLEAVAGSGAEDLDAAAIAAGIDGAESTKDMSSGRGRSSYLGDRVLGTPDPGALGMALALALIAEGAGANVEAERERLAALIG
ncbi:dihydroxyacetone kinase subunit DhaK [Dermabacter hominis]|uniref:dihydroxyacetone kinase subunit DhaK n=1 Tax=Dermabacter hominis TaxID=36740 RepID=UPI0021A3B7BC|nr:dihydroxyacetone kinase subunit DhaK [Dermabacter hominis]MCT1956455.1 dihydroxyacetone kinase subunit DhaK [Dermabacter hominis]MDU4693802.1 dihydroxyacetone kinase subunit DhaK [Dermabacter sp.]